MKFNKGYFLLAIGLFIIEVLIALYMNDRIIRPYGGDFLVVILIYCLVKSFFSVRVLPAAFGVLIFAFFVEWLQYHGAVYRLGLGGSKLAMVVIGSSFEWIDLLAYTGGVLLILLVEKIE